MCIVLFRLQKYKKFESNSQLQPFLEHNFKCCFDCKSTKNLRAIHNLSVYALFMMDRCFDCKSTKNLRAIHNFKDLYDIHEYVVSTAKVQKI